MISKTSSSSSPSVKSSLPRQFPELFAPISGQIIEVNAELEERPELVNEEPYEAGWMLKVQLSDTSEMDNLMSADQYEALVAESE